MNKPPCRGFLPLKNEDGFTLIEVLIALTILSGLSFLLVSLVSRSSSSIDKTFNLGRRNMLTLRIDDALREEFCKVRPPYWLSEIPYTIQENGISFSYYNGDPDASLIVFHEDNDLVIERDGEKIFFRGIADVEFDISREGQSGDIVVVTVTFMKDEPTRHTVVLGGACITNE